jgi:hypothetical protein
MSSSGDRLRNQAGVCRAEESFGRAVKQSDDDRLPDAHRAGRDEQGQDAMQYCSAQVGQNNHRLARESIGHHATDEDEGHQRGCVGGKNVRDVGGTVSQPGDEQPDGDDDERVAHYAHRLAHPEQPEITRAQRRQHTPTVTVASPELD